MLGVQFYLTVGIYEINISPFESNISFKLFAKLNIG